jgi:hypothetical protein
MTTPVLCFSEGPVLAAIRQVALAARPTRGTAVRSSKGANRSSQALVTALGVANGTGGRDAAGRIVPGKFSYVPPHLRNPGPPRCPTAVDAEGKPVPDDNSWKAAAGGNVRAPFGAPARKP